MCPAIEFHLVSLDERSNLIWNAVVIHHIHAPTEVLLQFFLHASQRGQSDPPARTYTHEDVDVAVWAKVRPHRRAENGQFSEPETLGKILPGPAR